MWPFLLKTLSINLTPLSEAANTQRTQRVTKHRHTRRQSSGPYLTIQPEMLKNSPHPPGFFDHKESLSTSLGHHTLHFGPFPLRFFLRIQFTLPHLLYLMNTSLKNRSGRQRKTWCVYMCVCGVQDVKRRDWIGRKKNQMWKCEVLSAGAIAQRSENEQCQKNYVYVCPIVPLYDQKAKNCDSKKLWTPICCVAAVVSCCWTLSKEAFSKVNIVLKKGKKIVNEKKLFILGDVFIWTSLFYKHNCRASAFELVTADLGCPYEKPVTVTDEPERSSLELSVFSNKQGQGGLPPLFAAHPPALPPPFCLSTSMGNTSLLCLQHRVSAIQLGTQSSSSTNSIKLVWRLLNNGICFTLHTHTHWHTNKIFISPSGFPCLVQLAGLWHPVAPQGA